MNARKVGGARASRVGALGFTVLALILTGLTALLLVKVMGESKFAQEPVQDVVVAATKIQAAEPIKEEHLKVVKWPVSAVPEGAFGSIDELLGPHPRVPVSTILSGEPVLKARLAEAKAGTGMASQVPSELRAFPISVDAAVAEARLVYPGAVVDILATIRDSVQRKVSTKMVLQKIRVLAVDGEVDAAGMASEEEEKKKKDKGIIRKTVVTLLVTPEEAEALALASREGAIDLILRNAQDKAVVETFGITPPELLGEADPAEVEAALTELRADAQLRREAERKVRKEGGRSPAPSTPSRTDTRDSNYPPDDQPIRRSGGTKTISIGAK